MRNFFLFILLSISSLIFLNVASNAQSLPKITIGNVYQSAESIEFNITATEPFYVGANVFVLHIGNFSFDLYRQTDADGKGNLAFIIPINEFNLLKESMPIFVTYGNLFSNDASIKEKQLAAKENAELCQYLGQFSPKIMNK
jgi:hypothetical protein